MKQSHCYVYIVNIYIYKLYLQRIFRHEFVAGFRTNSDTFILPTAQNWKKKKK